MWKLLQKRSVRLWCPTFMSVFLQIRSEQGQRFRTSKFKKIPIASGGKCGWHALVASQDLSRYQQIPRNQAAYLCSRRLLLEQEEAATKLHSSVCKQALEVCHPRFHDAIHRVIADPQFIPTDLEWIARACNFTIRCTCAPQAVGIFKNPHLETLTRFSPPPDLYTYRNIYIYTHTV